MKQIAIASRIIVRCEEVWNREIDENLVIYEWK